MKSRCLILSFLIYLFGFLFLIFGSRIAHAQEVALSITPAQGEFSVGSVFTVSLQLDTRGEAVGLVSAILTYPPDIVQIIDPGAGSSFITSWHNAPLVSNFDGTMSFTGGISPGITMSGGTVLTVLFRAVAPGTATLAFAAVRIENAPEHGRAYEVQRLPAVYHISLAPSGGPRIESPTHPHADVWYSQPTAIFVWNKTDGGVYRFVFNQEPFALLQGVVERSGNSLTIPLQHDGIWYAHISVQENDESWSEPARYVVRVDRIAPRKPEITIRRELRNTVVRYHIAFSASDAVSGVDRYQARVIPPEDARVTQGFFTETESPLFLTNPKEGIWHVSVRAYDKAGNFSEAEEDILVAKAGGMPVSVFGFLLPRSPAWLVAYAMALVALAALAALAYEFFRHHRDVRKKILRDAETAEQKLKRSLADIARKYGKSAEGEGIQQAIDALHTAHSATSPPPTPPPR